MSLDGETQVPQGVVDGEVLVLVLVLRRHHEVVEAAVGERVRLELMDGERVLEVLVLVLVLEEVRVRDGGTHHHSRVLGMYRAAILPSCCIVIFV